MRRVFASVLALVLAAGAAQASTIVINGGFEMDAGPGKTRNNLSKDVVFSNMPTHGPSWGIWDSIPGWSSKDAGVEIQTNRTLRQIDAHSGEYYTELDTYRNSTIYQDVTLGAGRHKLTFWYSPRTHDPKTNGIDFALGSLVGGSITGPSSDVTYGDWTKVVQGFTVDTPGTYQLSFAASGKSNSYGGLLDDVAISAVPLPAGALLLMTGLAGLGLARRRR